ncbi:TPA: hypothetical protein DCZ39_02210 [Patescibacteria group bacterium]|nr:hypothetical protein [Candidatus Gracilibacteria bacterium]
MPKIPVTKTTAKKLSVKSAPKVKTSSKIKEEKKPSTAGKPAMVDKPIEKESAAKVLKSDELLG